MKKLSLQQTFWNLFMKNVGNFCRRMKFLDQVSVITYYRLLNLPSTVRDARDELKNKCFAGNFCLTWDVAIMKSEKSFFGSNQG